MTFRGGASFVKLLKDENAVMEAFVHEYLKSNQESVFACYPGDLLKPPLYEIFKDYNNKSVFYQIFIERFIFLKGYEYSLERVSYIK